MLGGAGDKDISGPSPFPQAKQMVEFNPYPSEDTEQVPARVRRDPWDTPAGYRMAWYEWALAFLAAVLLVWFCWSFTAQAMGYEPVVAAQSSWTAMWGGR